MNVQYKWWVGWSLVSTVMRMEIRGDKMLIREYAHISYSIYPDGDLYLSDGSM